MKSSSLFFALLFAVAFLFTVLIRLPLRWAAPLLLPRAVHCQMPEGSLWAGRCGQLDWTGASGAIRVGDVSWAMRPARLLRTRLAFDIRVLRGAAQAEALVQLGFGRLEVLDLAARGPIDPSIVKGFPPGWTGELELAGVRLRLDDGKLAALDGTVVARNLVSQTPHATAWGSYQLRIPKREGGQLAPGELHDLEGPLQLQGSLRLSPDFSWQLDGGVAARSTADPELTRQIQYLGSPDAQGLRPFSLAGSF